MPWGPSVGQVARRGVLRVSTAEAEHVALIEGEKETLFAGAVLSFFCQDPSGSCARAFEGNHGRETS